MIALRKKDRERSPSRPASGIPADPEAGKKRSRVFFLDNK
jgi:hypothetical protein